MSHSPDAFTDAAHDAVSHARSNARSDAFAARMIAHGPDDLVRLSSDEFGRYLEHARRLVYETRWEGAKGFEVTDEMIDTISAHGALLGAGFDPSLTPFADVTTIIVHAETIIRTGSQQSASVGGVYSDGPQYMAGLAEPGRGPLVFDWDTVRSDVSYYSRRGSNVVYHEFAHKLDQISGSADGVPPLDNDDEIEAWKQTMGTNFRRLQRRGQTGIVRAYAATNLAEYFAVVSELFFTRPLDLRAELPRVYERLATFYRQDPSVRANT